MCFIIGIIFRYFQKQEILCKSLDGIGILIYLNIERSRRICDEYILIGMPSFPRPLQRCPPRPQYDGDELPLFRCFWSCVQSGTSLKGTQASRTP